MHLLAPAAISGTIAAVRALVTLLALASLLGSTDAAHARASADALPCAIPGLAPRPMRVLMIGDSNFFGSLGHRVERGFRARGYEVHIRAKPSSGLARPDFFDWFRETRRLIAVSRPDVIVAMLGANDVQRITWPRLARRVFWQDQPGWRTAYEARVRTFMQMLADDGREVFYLSPTNRGWPVARDAVDKVRDIQQRVAGDLPRVHWIDMFPLSSNAHGEWLRFGVGEDGKRIWYRQPDRIHLTKLGGELIGARLLRYLSRFGV